MCGGDLQTCSPRFYLLSRLEVWRWLLAFSGAFCSMVAIRGCLGRVAVPRDRLQGTECPATHLETTFCGYSSFSDTLPNFPSTVPLPSNPPEPHIQRRNPDFFHGRGAGASRWHCRAVLSRLRAQARGRCLAPRSRAPGVRTRWEAAKAVAPHGRQLRFGPPPWQKMCPCPCCLKRAGMTEPPEATPLQRHNP